MHFLGIIPSHKGMILQDKCLTEIKKARKLHLDWVRRAEMLVQGLPILEESIPLNSKKCLFGMWFHTAAKQLLSMGNFEKLINEIDKDHENLHREYQFIYNIYFKVETSSSFFTKIFTKKEPVISTDEQGTAKNHLETLLLISKSLTKNLDKFSSQVSLLTPDNISEIKESTAL